MLTSNRGGRKGKRCTLSPRKSGFCGHHEKVHVKSKRPHNSKVDEVRDSTLNHIGDKAIHWFLFKASPEQVEAISTLRKAIHEG